MPEGALAAKRVGEKGQPGFGTEGEAKATLIATTRPAGICAGRRPKLSVRKREKEMEPPSTTDAFELPGPSTTAPAV